MTNKYQQELELLIKNAKPLGHIPEEKADGMINVVTCSCGWSSRPHFDGADFALGAWIKHAEPLVEKGQAELILK